MSAPPGGAPGAAAPEESLAPAPAGSAWGRRTARVYLALAALSLAVALIEMVRGRPGPGSLALSVLTSPWSALLAPLARGLAASLPGAAVQALGLALAAGCAALNARILYGIAARTERDALERRAPGGRVR